MILSRVRLLPQQRYDLEDFNAQQSGARTDSKLWTKQFLTDRNSILKGFSVSGIGFNQATVIVNNGTLVIPENTNDFSWYTVEAGASNIIVPDAALIDGSRNYLELQVLTETNTPVVKSFWDPSANGGVGAEFNQQIDTMVDLKVEVVVSTGGFSGDPDRIPLAIIDVDNSGVIKIILDRRELFFRNGTPTDIDEGFTWVSQTEPGYTMVLTGVTGTFEPGEEITIGSVTAKLVSGTTSPLVFNVPDGINFAFGDTVTGSDSGATGTVASILESFSGADKDIDNMFEMNRALMTEMRSIKGTRFWYEEAGVSLTSLSKSLSFSKFLYITCDENVEWSGTDLVFTQDIVLQRIKQDDDTVTEHSIQVADSPISIADGEYIYVLLDKTVSSENLTVYNSGTTPISSHDLNAKEAVVLFRRLDNPVSGSSELYLPFSKQFITEGQVFRIGASGSGSGAGGFKITAYDPTTSTLPTGTSFIADGVTLVDGDMVLFSNLSSGNNQVYKVSGVGTSLVWTAVRAFENGSFTPTDGDRALILEGTIFADQTAIWNGTEFVINDVVRYFDGVNYWQQESPKITTLLDNQSVAQDIFSIVAQGSENMIIDFSMIRGSQKEMGTLLVTHDNTDVSIVRTSAAIGNANGVLFEAILDSGNLKLQYTSSNSGDDAEFKFIIKRWSDAAGGPSGVPSYIQSGGGAGAGGLNTQVQYNNAGALDGSADFTWSESSKTLSLSDLKIQGVDAPFVLADNQSSPATFLTLDSSTYKHAVLEYSGVKDGGYRTGRLLVASDGTVVSASDDYIETASTGIVFSAVMSGSDILLQYTTTLTGGAGSLKFSIRKWI